MTKDCGQIVFYGMAGGDPAPVDPRVLMDSSKTLTGGDLWSYLTSAPERRRRADQLFAWVRSGQLRPEPATTFRLPEGRQAHEYLESRLSTGKILLLPRNGGKRLPEGFSEQLGQVAVPRNSC